MKISSFRASDMLVFFTVLCIIPLQASALTQVVACFERPSAGTNIPGDPTLVELTKLQNCIKVDSIEFGAQNSTRFDASKASTGGLLLGRAAFNSVVLKKSTDDATPALLLNVFANTRYGEVRIFFFSNVINTEVVTANVILQLGIVVVTKYEGNAESNLPENEVRGNETVTLNFAQMRMTVGTRSSSWNQITNKAEAPNLPAL